MEKVVLYSSMGWHDIRDNKEDLPTSGKWFICKVRDASELKLVKGFNKVDAFHFDGWAEVRCPFMMCLW